MHFFKINTPFFLFLFAFLISRSQTYNFKNYGLDDGLPQSQVLSIFQDHKGYMWFGTNTGGVGRFDGRTFIKFSKEQGLIDNTIYSITETKKHELFFATGKGLSIYDNFSFKNYGEKEGLKNPMVFKVLSQEDKVWVTTQEGVYIYKDGKLSPFLEDTILTKSTVWSALADKNGNLWFATFQNGVIYYNCKNKTFKHFTSKEGLTNNQVFSLAEMNDGTLLIGTLTGLSKIDKDFKVSEAGEVEHHKNICFWSILKDGGNNFYFGTYAEGLLNYDFKSGKKFFFNAINGLTSNPVMSLLKDKEGNIWIGTADGVYKYHYNTFVYYKKANGLLDNYIDNVNVDNQGNVWLSIAANGVAKIQDNTITNYKTDFKKNGLPDNNVKAILPVENGKIYFGTEYGLSVFENGVFTTLKSEIFNRKYILSLFKDSKNKIWIGTNSGVFSLIDNVISEEKIINSFDTKGQQFAVFCITEDKQGKLFFGLESGMLQFDGKQIKHLDDKSGFGKERTVASVNDFKNNSWFGTAEGLYLYTNSKFIKVNKMDGAGFGAVNFLETDKKGRLYIGGNKGVEILYLKEYYADKIHTKHLGKEDGLVSNETNFKASVIDKEGKLLIGSPAGLSVYDPNADSDNTTEVLPTLTDVKLFYGQENILEYSDGIDSTTLLPKNLVLPYSKNSLSFYYIGISFISSEVMYQYKLEGLDNDWTPPLNNTEAVYPSLPPGKYTFKIKAMNSNGIWNKEPLTYSFEILAPWYKTVLFYALCVIVLISGIMFYNYTRTKKLVADKQKLEKIVDERTKELREEKEKVEVINKEVIEQKTEIEYKNLEITDSIKYAKNIQEALLPSLTETEKAFKNCFILYEPKDIVSGDFFWFSHNEKTQFIAAADCTGHGVPGAFMSIVGNTLLNEIVDHQNIEHPGDILLELHKGVKIALNQNHSESQRRDGMDIALCAITPGKNTIEYSGANRPLWIYRKNENYKLEIIKATKSPIGGLELEESRAYENNTVEVFEGDMLYFFSDGFADQFGGPKGKKFMIANMQKLLLENIELPMQTQKHNIKKAFDSWKGEAEQIDDVLIIGIRI